jgi:hypothetical protein
MRHLARLRLRRLGEFDDAMPAKTYRGPAQPIRIDAHTVRTTPAPLGVATHKAVLPQRSTDQRPAVSGWAASQVPTSRAAGTEARDERSSGAKPSLSTERERALSR